jgi:hypothetical protein
MQRSMIMTPDKRIVTHIPLTELWREDETVVARREGFLSPGEVRDLLRVGRVRFVVAEVGRPLRWISPADAFAFWRSDASRRLADPTGFSLDEFPNAMAYLASRWEERASADPIVVLETHH